MADYTFKKQEEMECPMCGKKHMVELRTRIATLNVKGLAVDYQEDYYYCEFAEEEEKKEFVTGKVMEENFNRAKANFDAKMGFHESGSCGQ